MKYIEDLLQSLFIMASMVEARDPYTGGHLWRVAQYSRLLAEAVGMPKDEVARISAGGFLHDLGKIGVPDHILRKPDRLTDEEFAVIRTHPEVGSRLLQGHPLAGLVIKVVQSHHETPAGTGYPEALSGDAIAPEARIVGICDAFDAMTSNRPYRRGMPVDKALSIIESKLGRQFDGVYGRIFVELGREGLLNHIVGHSEVGIPLQECPICGPTIVVTRKHVNGDHLFCRNCGGKAVLERSGQHISLRPTGEKGSAAELEAELNIDLIQELVTSASDHLNNRTLSASAKEEAIL
ncbi:MAG: phosphohydrolase [Zetaproteobacteria bacterium CG1_02_53_45]|nr:MAG: phosphohydrolase [Zetaproteobacteria bacterium CG1_02_53_45]